MTDSFPDTAARITSRAHLNYLEFFRELARWSGRSGEIAEYAGVLLWATGSTVPVQFNGTVRLDPAVSPAEALAIAAEWFGDRDRRFTIVASDRDGVDDDLAAAAIAAGYTQVFEQPEMVLTAPVAATPVPADVDLRWIADLNGVEDWMEVTSVAYADYGLTPDVLPAVVRDPDSFLAPHVETVIAYIRGTPLATAQVHNSHGLAGIYWIGTREDARGTGLGDAVTRAASNRGFARGASAVTLQATDQGEGIYRRMGYETLYRYRGLLSPS